MKTKQAVVNTKALSLDWETYDRAQDALDPFRLGPDRGVDIRKYPLEWKMAAGLAALSVWTMYTVGRGR